MAMARKDLGEALVAKSVITAEQLGEARDVQRSAPGDIGRIIIDLGFAEEKQVTEVRAETLGMPFVDLATQRLDPAAVNSVPEHVARKHKVLAIGKNGSRLIVAVVNPNDPFAMQDIRVTSGVQQIAMGLATEDDMMDALDKAYKSNGGGGGGAESISLPNTPDLPLGRRSRGYGFIG